MSGRGEGLALALLRVCLGLLWLQDLVLPTLAPQGWLVAALDLPPAAGWVLPAVEVCLVALLLTGLLVRPAAAVGAAVGVAGAMHLDVGSGAAATGAWAVVLLAVAHAVLVVGGGGSWGALDAVRRSGDRGVAARQVRGWGVLALAAGVTGVVLATHAQPLWTAEHPLAPPHALVSLGTWDLPGALAVGSAGLVLLLATVPRMSPMALVALLLAGGAAVLAVVGVVAGGTASASLLAAVAVVAAVCAPRLAGQGGGDWGGGGGDEG